MVENVARIVGKVDRVKVVTVRTGELMVSFMILAIWFFLDWFFEISLKKKCSDVTFDQGSAFYSFWATNSV